MLNAANAFGLSTAQYMTQEKSGGTIRAGPIGVELANALYNRGYTDPSNHSGYITTTPSEQTTILQLGQTLGVSQDAVPYMNFANMVSNFSHSNDFSGLNRVMFLVVRRVGT